MFRLWLLREICHFSRHYADKSSWLKIKEKQRGFLKISIRARIKLKKFVKSFISFLDF